jgi:hypothetical protein
MYWAQLPPPPLPPHTHPCCCIPQNQAAANRLLEDWEAAGWVDPVTGAVTQPDTLPVCGATLARRRGYVAAALAAQAAAAHRWGGVGSGWR